MLLNCLLSLLNSVILFLLFIKYLHVSTHEGQEAIERTLAKKAVEFVKSGMVIGLGSGSVISLVIEELGRLIREGKVCFP